MNKSENTAEQVKNEQHFSDSEVNDVVNDMNQDGGHDYSSSSHETSTEQDREGNYFSDEDIESLLHDFEQHDMTQKATSGHKKMGREQRTTGKEKVASGTSQETSSNISEEPVEEFSKSHDRGDRSGDGLNKETTAQQGRSSGEKKGNLVLNLFRRVKTRFNGWRIKRAKARVERLEKGHSLTGRNMGSSSTGEEKKRDRPQEKDKKGATLEVKDDFYSRLNLLRESGKKLTDEQRDRILGNDKLSETKKVFLLYHLNEENPKKSIQMYYADKRKGSEQKLRTERVKKQEKEQGKSRQGLGNDFGDKAGRFVKNALRFQVD